MSDKKYIIKDPVYGTMSVSEEVGKYIKPIIDHPLFQRLRHIKQLSFVDLIFPGATHTRFNHSIGCAYNCNRIYNQIFPGENNDEERLITVAGLLHDIGHGPFSHSFEKISILKDKKITHEDWFSLFVDEIIDNDNETLKSLFRDNYSGEPWKKAIISSQLDADRMDYVLRDSVLCGVKYGIYDHDWLISCFTTDSNNNLAITTKGIGSAEQFLMARNILYRNVYLNPKADAISVCFINFMEELIKDIENIKFDNHLIRLIKKCAVNASKNKKEFMQVIKKDYYNLVDFDVWQTIRELAMNSKESVCKQLASRMYFRKLPNARELIPSQTANASHEINDFIDKHKIPEWKLKVISSSANFYYDNNQNSSIYVVDSQGTTDLTRRSKTVSNIANQNDSISYLYVDISLHNNNEVSKLILNFENKYFLNTLNIEGK